MSSDQTKNRLKIRGFLISLTAATVGVLLPGAFSSVSAQPYGTVTSSVGNSSPVQGSTDNFSASGFQPNSGTQVFLESTPILLETVPADATGTVASSVTIPSDAAPGAHDIVVSGVDASGATMSVSIPITVLTATTTSAGSGSGLAFTGADIALVTSVGAVALGFGGFLLLSVRRKRQALER
jgi:hypothetical protein